MKSTNPYRSYADDYAFFPDELKETPLGEGPEETFVWKKKLKRDKKRKSEQPVDQEQVRKELELLKRRRLEREEERKLREEERILAQREADRAQFGDWETREDTFQLHQMLKRAEVRIQENRPHAIDLLALPLLLLQTPSFQAHVAVRDPAAYLESLSMTDVDKLMEDLEVFLVLELDPAHQAYWTCISQLCQAQRAHAKSWMTSRVSSSVHQDIHALLKDKTLPQLMQLEESIALKLRSNEPIDTDYWEEMRAAVQRWQAKRHVVQVYQDALQARRAYCLAHQIIEENNSAALEEDHPASVTATTTTTTTSSSSTSSTTGTTTTANTSSSLPAPEDQEKEVVFRREEEEMAKEIQLTEQKTYAWAYKYRPRKPKYVNRVNTGYEWNKYNQTHYDMDNPPPKVVQGYKFNIFYPDLLDRSKAPTYRIQPKPNSPETAIIQFTAGAPYEDIAFEIVNKEWEMSHRKGFRCVFDRGVLQLHFQFKRYFYRK